MRYSLKQESPEKRLWPLFRAWRLTQRSLPSVRRSEKSIRTAGRQGIASSGLPWKRRAWP